MQASFTCPKGIMAESNINRCGLHQPIERLRKACIIAVAGLLWLAGSIGVLENHRALAYNSSDTDSAHQWIIARAIDYLKKKGPAQAGQYPWATYQTWLNYGVKYADNTELNCTWYIDPDDPWFDGGCDAIHHYGLVDDIKLFEPGLPAAGVTVANPGGFAAPFYAAVLYDLAIDFWPGGDKPNLADLPEKDGGYITSVFDGNLLSTTWVGGLPFCVKYVAEETGVSLVDMSACPKWPAWASTDTAAPINQRNKTAKEDIETAMKYLGWAIHMIEDMTVPVHANNETGNLHKMYENQVDKYIKSGAFDHLPVAPTGIYKYKPCNLCTDGDFSYPVSPDYFDKPTWKGEDFALAGRKVAVDADSGASIQPSYGAYKKNYMNRWDQSMAEHCVDTAIKLVAGLLANYIDAVAFVGGDQLEDNDTYYTAATIGEGSYDQLTCDSPNDDDWYQIVVKNNFSDLVIDIYDDSKTKDGVAARVVSPTSSWAGVAAKTAYGLRIEMHGIAAGDYRLHVYPTDQAVHYRMTVGLSTGALPADQYEDNDTPQTAKKFYNGCDFTDTLTIDRAGDDDYYYVHLPFGWKVNVDIGFDATGGPLDLFLDGVKATDASMGFDNEKIVGISGCGMGTSAIIRVAGSRNRYSLCVDTRKDASCPVPVFENPWKPYPIIDKDRLKDLKLITAK